MFYKMRTTGDLGGGPLFWKFEMSDSATQKRIGARRMSGRTVLKFPLVPACVFLFLINTHAGSNFQDVQQSGNCLPGRADEVICRMLLMNAKRGTGLAAYQGKRVYRLQYKGVIGDLSAEMFVHVNYHAPDKKDFTVLSEAGSRILLQHVLHRLLESEKEASNSENRTRAALDLDNYSFTRIGVERSAAGGQFLFSISARRKSKFLYNGKIWIDARDYAVTRIEAEPVQNPSLWIKSTKITHTYSKVGDFWLPQYNRSVSRIRLGGTAILTIEYNEYEISKTVSSHSGTF